MNFKTFIQEDINLLAEFTKHNLPSLISNYAIPLSTGMMDRLGYSEDGKTAYHLTNFQKHFNDMVKGQNKKGQISCFTKGGFELTRIPSQPDVLVKLQGKMVIEGKTDIWTLASTRGVRWLDQKNRVDKFLTIDIRSVVAKSFREINQPDTYEMTSEEIETAINNLSNKDQIKFYKVYIKNIERYLDSGGYKLLNNYLKKASPMSYNEVIMERFKILEVSCVQIEQDFIVAELAELGIPYGGLVNYHDIKKINI